MEGPLLLSLYLSEDTMKKQITMQQGKTLQKTVGNTTTLHPIDEKPIGQVKYLRALTKEEVRVRKRKIARKARILAKNEIEIFTIVERMIRVNNEFGALMEKHLTQKFKLLGHHNPEKLAHLYHQAWIRYKYGPPEILEKVLRKYFRGLLRGY